jgi:hypothetical protein
MKPKFLYHGSRKELVGDKLMPKKAGGLGTKAKNKLIAVYATDNKLAAIIMAIISGAKLSSMHFYRGKARGIIYEEWPKREVVYLYYLPSENFEKVDNWQWVSYEEVKPIKVKKIKVKEYIHLVRKATKKEKERFYKKHGKEIQDLKRLNFKITQSKTTVFI